MRRRYIDDLIKMAEGEDGAAERVRRHPHVSQHLFDTGHQARHGVDENQPEKREDNQRCQ